MQISQSRLDGGAGAARQPQRPAARLQRIRFVGLFATLDRVPLIAQPADGGGDFLHGQPQVVGQLVNEYEPRPGRDPGEDLQLPVGQEKVSGRMPWHRERGFLLAA